MKEVVGCGCALHGVGRWRTDRDLWIPWLEFSPDNTVMTFGYYPFVLETLGEGAFVNSWRTQASTYCYLSLILSL